MKSLYAPLSKTLGIWRLLGIPALALTAAVAVAWSEEVVLRLEELFVAIEGTGVYGKIVFMFLFALVCLVGVLPASVMALASGALYGLVEGLALSAVALLTSAVTAFSLGRYLFREMLASWIARRLALKKLDAALAVGGWRIVGLIRLSPIAPFGVTSYAFGLTSVTLSQYILGSLGILPSLLLYVYSGTLAEKILVSSSIGGRPEGWQSWIPLMAGFAATLIAVLYLMRLVRTSFEVRNLRVD